MLRNDSVYPRLQTFTMKSLVFQKMSPTPPLDHTHATMSCLPISCPVVCYPALSWYIRTFHFFICVPPKDGRISILQIFSSVPFEEKLSGGTIEKTILLALAIFDEGWGKNGTSGVHSFHPTSYNYPRGKQ